jgi:phage shock protein PspC (stress-responsive transcriptional regulator)
MRDLGRLRRSITDRKVAGVAGGLARHLDVDPTLIRVLFVVLIFFGGAGLLLYGAAWLLVPEEGQDDGAISTSPGTRSTALIVVGVVAALLAIGDGWSGWGFGFPWPLAIVALVVFLVLANRDRGPKQMQPGPAGMGSPVAPPSQPGVAPGQTTSTTPVPPSAPVAPWSYQPPPQQPTEPWRPPRRTDRGPLLWWPTLALITLALGVLAAYDMSGHAVPGAAYPALALAVTGAMLVVGAWIGRTGGLVFLGVVAAIALALSSVVTWAGVGEIERQPTTAAELDSSYSLAAGRIEIDLTDIDDLDQLDGRTLELDATAGRMLVTVPDGLTVNMRGEIDGGGEIVFPDEREDGGDVLLEGRIDAGPNAPVLDLDMEMTFGSMEVQTQ